MAQILVMAGGTGGHVFPALAAAKELIARGHKVTWLGSKESFESRLVPTEGIEIDTIDIKGLRGNGIKRLLLAPLQLSRALLQASRVLKHRTPDLVIGMGGFAAAPGGVAARLMGIPLLIHEQNAIPGLTNRLLSKIASRVCQAFPGAFEGDKVVLTGNPVRPEITTLAEPQKRYDAREGKLQLLVVGGSLGAAALNKTVPAALALIDADKRPVVRHQAGRNKDAAAAESYRSAGIDASVSAFIDDMAEAFAWADLVICRSGALTVSELAAAGVAACLVPYPYAVDDHQTANGSYLADAGAAELIQERDLDAHLLANFIVASDRAKLKKMAVIARQLAKPDATSRVATLCEEALGHG
ncbi:undecaprenyldiphospho-muramoylpentapeptide beta-N-acetylglucosaminyltransferase [Solemya velum gill symbiont]|uniref:undecaprenyldiphospho-muramoylpentapeptide beta-N-acetylglucosaminyltransferase n=1 Tax=Solemya velum gill symbiont TaxID=2340 RepID=UPI000997E98B|nr:undecaprenyldiphospho-muramoylpentapeptide beta-N-acetylglucosaminyltransferase [Solemya velum gill symbiont]OOZ47350.1 undecaprenyldiphospho-muramoylpentapeptide beta-N-acetylglucosaminyltransferase [Solemya velum gill symbiont]OOZ49765.1 undecaprenyldiphospho-muramoylpentapeptide beta-N-acetylglucosaminyltransferase [Solemya velum gill symbiont]OOZ52452.1 undecaprenyldiphospho-muramoylpentapeptide beta-N-acetylglucosaminyltransferase [Solemya velum gill symbiont]OOZ55341.1 undecaprenyldiph